MCFPCEWFFCFLFFKLIGMGIGLVCLIIYFFSASALIYIIFSPDETYVECTLKKQRIRNKEGVVRSV